MIPLAVFCVLLIILLSTQILRYPSFRVFWEFSKLPAPWSLPILGPVRKVMFLKNNEIVSFFAENYICGYRRRFNASWFLGMPMVTLFDPEDLKELLGNTNHTTKGIEYDLLRTWIGDGLLTSSGDKWQRRRKMLMTAFHYKILEDNLPTIWNHSKTMVNNLLQTCGELTPIDDHTNKCILDILCKAVMNVKLDAQDRTNVEYVRAVRRVSEGFMFRMMNFYLNRDWLWNLTPMGRKYNKNLSTIHSFTKNVVACRRSELMKEMTDEADISRPAKKLRPLLDRMIDMDMKDPGCLTDEGIQEEVNTFMFAGHGTTSATIGLILWEIGRRQDIQEKIYTEIQEIFGDSEREITTDDLSKMNYLDNVIKEGMRLYPAVPWTSRTLSHDIYLGDSTKMSAGFNVVVTSFFVHRNPNLYPDPMKFDPDRFTPEECAKRHPFAYIPFSGGPRACLGQKLAIMTIKVVLSTVLRFCKIKSVTTEKELVLLPLVTMSTENSIMITVSPRKN